MKSDEIFEIQGLPCPSVNEFLVELSDGLLNDKLI